MALITSRIVINRAPPASNGPNHPGLRALQSSIQSFQINNACEAATGAAHACNKYLQDTAIWGKMIRSALEATYVLAHLLELLIPAASATILACFNMPAVPLPSLSARLDMLTAGAAVSANCILFQKFEEEEGAAAAAGGAGKDGKGGKADRGKTPKGGGKGAKGAKTAGGGDKEPPAVIDIADDRVVGSLDIRVGFMCVSPAPGWNTPFQQHRTDDTRAGRCSTRRSLSACSKYGMSSTTMAVITSVALQVKRPETPEL